MARTATPTTWTRPKAVTYLGVSARITERRTVPSKATCLRAVATMWDADASPKNGGHPAGTIVVALIEGDGREPGFRKHATRVLAPGATLDDAHAAGDALLAEHTA